MIGILQRLRPHQAVFRWAEELELDTELSKAVRSFGSAEPGFPHISTSVNAGE